jgi:uncharacterized protein YbaP (TraB family)
MGLALMLAGPGLALPPVWTVHGKGCEITLFGSVHILPEGLDWEPPALAQALQRADQLWFEIPIDDASQAQIAAIAQARGLLPEGDSLSAHLSPAGGRRLAAAVKAQGLDMTKLDRFRPWFAELALSQAVYQAQGGRADQGVEEQLAQAAPQARREAFETADQQIALFADAPVQAQVASLEDTLRELNDDPGAFRRLIDAWVRGDVKSIYKHDVLTLKHDAPALFKTLITDRNAAWTQVLDQTLKASCRAVVVVGAGHLLGPGGVPARLRALGYRVDGPG